MLQIAYIGPAVGPSSGAWPLWLWAVVLVVGILLIALVAVGMGEMGRRSRTRQ